MQEVIAELLPHCVSSCKLGLTYRILVSISAIISSTSDIVPTGLSSLPSSHKTLITLQILSTSGLKQTLHIQSVICRLA
jgi:hypothetical protein